jgi:hypothetical protein
MSRVLALALAAVVALAALVAGRLLAGAAEPDVPGPIVVERPAAPGQPDGGRPVPTSPTTAGPSIVPPPTIGPTAPPPDDDGSADDQPADDADGSVEGEDVG